MGFEEELGRKTAMQACMLCYPDVLELAKTSDEPLFFQRRKVRPREEP